MKFFSKKLIGSVLALSLCAAMTVPAMAQESNSGLPEEPAAAAEEVPVQLKRAVCWLFDAHGRFVKWAVLTEQNGVLEIPEWPCSKIVSWDAEDQDISLLPGQRVTLDDLQNMGTWDSDDVCIVFDAQEGKPETPDMPDSFWIQVTSPHGSDWGVKWLGKGRTIRLFGCNPCRRDWNALHLVGTDLYIEPDALIHQEELARYFPGHSGTMAVEFEAVKI